MDKVQQAKVLLEEGLFTDTADQIKEQLFDQWIATEWEEIDEREYIWRSFKNIDALVNRIKSVIDDETFKRHLNKEK